MNSYLDKFMKQAGNTALTFDDVTLVTQYADFLPSETNLKTKFTRNVNLNIPFVSAAMDTVTESKMAIEIARMGGIGVIHRGLDPVQQSKNVAKVKHYLNGLISDPVVFNENQTVDEVLNIRSSKMYKFMGFPIINGNGKLTGILTSSDIKFLKKTNVKIKSVMTTDLITAPASASLNKAFDIMRKNKVGKLPLINRGKLVGLYSYTDVKNIIEKNQPLINSDKNYQLRVAAAVGTNDFLRVEKLCEEKVDVIVIDTAHGHSKGVIDMVKWVKKNYTVADVVAGNIASGAAAKDLLKAGADAVKVGIGPGSICTTRVITGVGIPQITAVYEVSKALAGAIPVISDGGIRHSGDVPKAIVAGANSIMMGSALAGTDESPGEKIIRHGRQYVVYRGMGSLGAMKSSASSRERYSQQDVSDTDKLVPEGIEGLVPYAGHVAGVIQQFVGGLRSSMGYNGAKTISKLREIGIFKRITASGVREAHPHDVRISKEAPNYKTTGVME